MKLGSSFGPNPEQGNAVVYALVFAAVVGGVVTAISQRNVNDKRRMLKMQSSESTQQINLNNLNVLQAALQFPGSIAPAQQTADNPAFVPAVFPDPYINPTGQPVALKAFGQAPSNGRWASDGNGAITLSGFDPTAISATDMNNMFNQGTSIPSNAGYATASKVSFNAVQLKNGTTTISAINVKSQTNLTKATGTAQSEFNADIILPSPPPPILVASGLPTSPVNLNTPFAISLHGYGLMTAASISAGGGQNINLTIPPAAYSLQNTKDGGFDLGTYTLNAAEIDGPSSPPSATTGTFYVYLSAAGPGGSMQSQTVGVTVKTPVSCAFAQPSYNIAAGASGVVSMNTVGAASASIFNPFTNAWIPGAAATISPPTSAGGAFTNIPAKITGTDGTHATCTYNVNVAAETPPNPLPAPICWDHSYQYDVPLNVWYGGGPALAYYAQAAQCDAYGNNCVPPVYYYFQAEFLSPDPGNPGQCTGVICIASQEYAPLGSCEAGAYFRNDGCFPPETKLAMEDGRYQRIDKLRDSDRLYNPLTGSSAGIRKVVKGPEALALIEIGYEGKVVHVTTKHAFLTPEGVKTAQDLRAGDEVFGSDSLTHRIEIYRRLPVAKDQQVYNVELDVPESDPAFHVLDAEGIMTGDLYLQQHPAKVAK